MRIPQRREDAFALNPDADQRTMEITPNPLFLFILVYIGVLCTYLGKMLKNSSNAKISTLKLLKIEYLRKIYTKLRVYILGIARGLKKTGSAPDPAASQDIKMTERILARIPVGSSSTLVVVDEDQYLVYDVSAPRVYRNLEELLSNEGDEVRAHEFDIIMEFEALLKEGLYG